MFYIIWHLNGIICSGGRLTYAENAISDPAKKGSAIYIIFGLE